MQAGEDATSLQAIEGKERLARGGGTFRDQPGWRTVLGELWRKQRAAWGLLRPLGEVSGRLCVTEGTGQSLAVGSSLQAQEFWEDEVGMHRGFEMFNPFGTSRCLG